MKAYSIWAIILLASISTAAAQPPIPTTKVGPDVDVIGEGQVVRGREAITVVRGWNSIHAANCVAGNVSNKPNVKLYSTTSEGITLNAPSNLPSMQALMIAQCATGNWVSFNVTKITGTSFTFNALQSWDYK